MGSANGVATADEPAVRFPGPAAAWVSPRHKRFWALVVLLAYTLVGFLALPWLAERFVPSELGAYLGRPVALEAVRVNPYLLTVEARGFAVQEATNGDDLVGFDRLFIDLEVASLFRWAWTFREITLEGPRVAFERFADGTVNLLKVFPDSPAEPGPQPEDTAGLPRLIIGSFQIIGGETRVRDGVPSTPFDLTVGPINVEIVEISTLPEDEGRQNVVIKTAEGTVLSWVGTLALAPLASSGTLTASGPYQSILISYFQDRIAAEVDRGETEVSLNYDISVNTNGEPSVRIDDLQVTYSNIGVIQDGTQTLQIPEVQVQGGWLEYPVQRAGAERIVLTQPEVFVWLDADGTLNLDRIVETGNVVSQSAEAGATPGSAERRSTPAAPAAGTASADDTPEEDAWELSLGTFAVADLSFRYEDRSLREPGRIELSDVDLTVSDLTNAPEARFPMELAVATEPGGILTLSGEFGVLPETVFDGALALDGIQVVAAQPFVSDAANVQIKDGRLSANVALKVSAEDELSADGDLAFEGFSVTDLEQQERLVGWERIAIDRFTFSMAENALALSELEIVEPFVRLFIAKDGSTNFSQLVVDSDSANGADAGGGVVEAESVEAGNDEAQNASAEDAEDVAATASAEQPRITIGSVRIEDGGVDFTDLGLPLPFRSRISDLNGALTTFDTASSEPSEVRLEGQVADYGLARIEGTLLPLGPEQQTDLRVLFRNVALPDLTPYTIRFAGREIAEGRMELDLGYKIEEGKLQGSNKLIISSLELGEKVEHPDAMDLPLGLAIALLKGPGGKIDLSVPVTGDVDDPKFSYGGLVLKALANVIVKAATSPFRLLGSLVGVESEDFDKLDFEPGVADLTPPEREKLAKLAEALTLRPELKLRITPVFDPEADLAELKKLNVDARIDSQLKALEAEGQNTEMLTERRYGVIETLFREAFPEAPTREIRNGFRRPVDPLQPNGKSVVDQTAYIAELRNRLIAAEQVGEAELQALANERSAAVTAALTGGMGETGDSSGGIESREEVGPVAVSEVDEVIGGGERIDPARIEEDEPKSVKVNKSGSIIMQLNLASSAS